MKNNALIGKISLVFGIIMGLVYVAAGVLVSFTDFLHFSQDYHKKLLGGVIVLYGLYRFFKVYKKSFDKNSDSEDDE